MRKGGGSLSIRQEMFLLSFLALVLVSFLFAGVLLKFLYDRNMENAKNTLRQSNSQIVTYTEGMFHENATIVEMLSRDRTVINAGYGNPATAIVIYDAIQKRNTNITYIYSGYSDGSLIINNYDTPAQYDATNRLWYLASAASDGVARLVYQDAATGEWLFSQCMKLVNGAGNMVGAVAIDCSNESISRQLSTKYQFNSQRSFIVDASGTVLIHPNESEVNASLERYMDPLTWNQIVNGRSNYAEYKKDGVQAMAYFERIAQTDFIVVTAIDASEVIDPLARNVAFLSLLIIGLSVMLGSALSRIFIHRFARPIQELSGRIQHIAQGHPEQARKSRFSNAEIDGIAQSIEVIVKDIADREEQRKAAEYLSFHDSMTGLYNRRFFDEELSRLDTAQNHPLCVVCCDVNGLKLVNDVFGHAVGDRLILGIADCLRKGCRAQDVLARTGGDEFNLILPRTSAAEAEQILLRIQSEFPKDTICGAEISASLGYAVKTERTQSMTDVLRMADEKMYERKLSQSAAMKRRTMFSIIATAESEGLVYPLSEEENAVLNAFSDAFCPDSRELLLESYRLRKIGLCTVVLSTGYSPETLGKRHAEIGYRILSSLDDYRGVAGYILHHQEHWDGSGWPAGLAGTDIPLLSRIIAVTEAYIVRGLPGLLEKDGIWYDPELVKLLARP